MADNESLLSVEVNFAQKLADNSKTIRDRAVKRLRTWLSARSASKNDFTEEDMLKLWKGLFYCMWMSDKPLIQEELATTISELVYFLKSTKSVENFIEIFFITMSREWYGIDFLRMNKFMMFIRVFIRVCFEMLHKKNWDERLLDLFLKSLQKTILNKNASETFPISLQLHLSDIYVEEYARVTEDSASSEIGMKVLEPYFKLYMDTKDEKLRANIKYKVFYYIIKISNVGLPEIPEKSSPPKKVETTTEKKTVSKSKTKPKLKSYSRLLHQQELETSAVPFLRFDYSAIAERFEKLASARKSSNKRDALHIAQKFKLMAKGIYPLVMELPDSGSDLDESDVEEAVEKLQNEFGSDPNKKRRRRPKKKIKKRTRF